MLRGQEIFYLDGKKYDYVAPAYWSTQTRHIYTWKHFYHEFAWNMSINKVTFVETQNYDYEY